MSITVTELVPLALIRRDIIFFVSTKKRQLALTFDDGPPPQTTPGVLDALRRHNARATFFLIGSRAQRHPKLVERIAREGHELGNHLWLDERASALSDGEFEDKLVRTHEVLTRTASVRLMRPGSGLVSRGKVRIVERHGYRCVLGSVYPYDPQLPLTGWMSWRVRVGAQPGAIVILHEGDPSRKRVVKVLNAVLPNLRRRGYQVVTASHLLRAAA